MSRPRGGRRGFLRMLSGSVAVQAMVSASNFVVGLLLIRRTADTQYGYYVLIATAVLLSTTLQGSYIQPPMIIRLTSSGREARAALVGGLYRDQHWLLRFIPILTLVFGLVLLFGGRLNFGMAFLLVAATAAIIAALHREFFRMVLFAYQRPDDVLRSDVVYGLLLMGGAFIATLTPAPAAVAALTLTLSCVVGSALLMRAMWRHEPWSTNAPPGMLLRIAHQGAWSAFGGGVHWLFSQGYNYLVAGLLDVPAVAALAATRLLVMPIGLLSTGIGTLMLPTTSRWSNEHGAFTILRRLVILSLALGAAAGCYLVVVWMARDWIFGHILKKSVAQRDLLLILWSLIAMVTLFRDQLMYFLVTRARFRLTSGLTFVSAVLSLSSSYFAMQRLGVAGALYALLGGEMFNVAGIIVLSWREAYRAPAPKAA